MRSLLVRRLSHIHSIYTTSISRTLREVHLTGTRNLSLCSLYATNHEFNKMNTEFCLFLRTNCALVHLRQNRHGHSESGTVLFNLADIGEGITEVTIKEWFIKEGDAVKEFDPICEVQSDKASVTITSRYEGVITKLLHDVDGIAKVGKPLIEISVGRSEHSAPLTDQGLSKTTNGSESMYHNSKVNKQLSEYKNINLIVPTLPSVRRMAKEHGIDLSKVLPSGKDGRVLKDDLINYLKNLESKTIDTSDSNTTSKIETNTTRQVKLNAIDKAMFTKMTESLKIPSFHLSDEVDMTKLLIFLKNVKSSKDLNCHKLNPLAFMVKSCSMALASFPKLNGSIGSDNQHIVVKEYHNIGIAIDTKDGLVLPNIKNVERLSVLEVSREIERLKNLGATGSLSISDITDGTFSLSNIGSIGGNFGVPVISPPELAIGAIGRIKRLPRFIEGSDKEVEARDIMQVVWSADHRVIDGATVARFSDLWKSYLNEPAMITLSLR